MNLTPKQTVTELDRFIVGHIEAKRAVAIALRNRWRRQQLPDNLRDEVLPKNILMIGPTGVGKTEIARRLAKLADAPFLKVEATKFTEVGYVGRDVDQIARDLMDVAVQMVRDKNRTFVRAKAAQTAEKRILDILCGATASDETRQKFQDMLRSGELNDREIDIEVEDKSPLMPTFDVPGAPGMQMGMMNIGDMIGQAMGQRTKTRKLPILEAMEIATDEEADKLLDEESIIREARDLTEQSGIVFLDEIDKICARSDGARTGGGDVSREGVQRDLLPLIEGTTVATKYGSIKTDHILFIASGAFHIAKPSDLLPELQGRLPIRVELKPLTRDDLKRILIEPEANLIRQATALIATENVQLMFSGEAIDAIADLAAQINAQIENIGARRLHTILEKVLEEISFDASERGSSTVIIDAPYVQKQIGDAAQKSDLSKFIL